MAFSGAKTRVWDRNTPDDGILFNVEFDNIYSDLNDLNDRSLPGYDDTGTPSDFDILLFDTGSSKYKRSDLRDVEILTSRELLRQSILNPNGLINQRAKVSPNFVDDTYYVDFWNLLKENAALTNGIVKHSVSDDAIQISVIDAVLTTRFGIIEFLESELSVQYGTKKASISFLVKANNVNIPNIRAAVLAWNSTPDTLTSDVVLVWADTPSLVPNWTFENTPSNISVSTGFTPVVIEEINIDTANLANLALFIWVPDQVNDTVLSIKECQMNIGTKVLKFGKRTKSIEQLMARRWYQTTYKEGVEAGTPTLEGAVLFTTHDGGVTSFAYRDTRFTESMRITPSGFPAIRLFGLAGTQDTVSNDLNTLVANEKTISSGSVIGQPTEKGFLSEFSIAPAAPTGTNGIRAFHYDADASL